MASEGTGQELRIGNALKEARRRAGLDIRTVEERTKIRTRYLRALEAEEWGALPGHAYIKGFLRTYADLLGLDGIALVDEYRRTVEGPQASPVPLGDGVLQARRGREPGEFRGPPSRWWILAAVILLIAAVLAVIGLAGDDEGDRAGKGDRKERQEKGNKNRGGGGGGGSPEQPQAAPETVTMRLVANTDGLQACLLGDDSRQPLIDGFVGSAGSEDVFEAKRLELRFPFGYDLGQFDLFVGGERVRLEELQGPAAFSIEPPRRVRPIDEPGTSCP